jgi:hypothetical protein
MADPTAVVAALVRELVKAGVVEARNDQPDVARPRRRPDPLRGPLEAGVTPEGRCPVCKMFTFVDGIASDGTVMSPPRLREHNTSDPGAIRRAREKAAKEGKRSARLPRCHGSDQAPTELRWPNGEPFYGDKAEVRLQWPGGAVYWEGPYGGPT